MTDRRNPKDLMGVKKISVGLFPSVAKIYGALAFEDGARKYGPYNWRDNDVLMTIYLDAAERHLLALRDGEWEDQKTKVPHLAYMIACAGLLADAHEGGNLIDDRPKPGKAAEVLERFMQIKEALPTFTQAQETTHNAAQSVKSARVRSKPTRGIRKSKAVPAAH